MREHGHWAHYGDDEGSELALWSSAADELSSGQLKRGTAKWEAFMSLPRSAGYADADSHLHAVSGRGPDDVEGNALRDQFQEFHKGDYFTCIDRSEAVMTGPSAAPMDRMLAVELATYCRAAYLDGRSSRLTLAPASGPKR